MLLTRCVSVCCTILCMCMKSLGDWLFLRFWNQRAWHRLTFHACGAHFNIPSNSNGIHPCPSAYFILQNMANWVPACRSDCEQGFVPNKPSNWLCNICAYKCIVEGYIWVFWNYELCFTHLPIYWNTGWVVMFPVVLLWVCPPYTATVHVQINILYSYSELDSNCTWLPWTKTSQVKRQEWIYKAL